MTIPTYTKNAALNGINFTHASLHTAFPGATGSNEVAGGSYTRQPITVNSGSGGSRALNSAVVFSVPIATIKWVGFWDSGAFLGCAPNGGSTPKNFMAVASTDTVYSSVHGWSDTQKIVFYNGTAPAGLTEGTTYFVRDSTADSFKVAATSGGAAIDLTAPSSFGCVVCAITEDVYASPTTHTLSTASVVIPD